MKLPPPAGPALRRPGDPAFLPSAGFDYKRTTPHVFVRVEEVAPDALKYANGPRSLRPGVAQIFRCELTGAERRWGIE
jgi:hypothetical protein